MAFCFHIPAYFVSYFCELKDTSKTHKTKRLAKIKEPMVSL